MLSIIMEPVCHSLLCAAKGSAQAALIFKKHLFSFRHCDFSAPGLKVSHVRNLLHATKLQIFLGRKWELLFILVWCSVRCSETLERRAQGLNAGLFFHLSFSMGLLLQTDLCHRSAACASVQVTSQIYGPESSKRRCLRENTQVG